MMRQSCADNLGAEGALNKLLFDKIGRCARFISDLPGRNRVVVDPEEPIDPRFADHRGQMLAFLRRYIADEVDLVPSQRRRFLQAVAQRRSQRRIVAGDNDVLIGEKMRSGE